GVGYVDRELAVRAGEVPTEVAGVALRPLLALGSLRALNSLWSLRAGLAPLNRRLAGLDAGLALGEVNDTQPPGGVVVAAVDDAGWAGNLPERNANTERNERDEHAERENTNTHHEPASLPPRTSEPNDATAQSARRNRGIPSTDRGACPADRPPSA